MQKFLFKSSGSKEESCSSLANSHGLPGNTQEKFMIIRFRRLKFCKSVKLKKMYRV